MNYGGIKIDNLKDNEVGKRIKSFAKKFFIMSLTFLIIYAFACLVLVFAHVASDTENSLLILTIGIIGGLVIYLIILGLYYAYIKSVGFGILVQDINEIKVLLENQNKKEEPKFYCSNCNARIDENATECPKCGAIFE